MQYGAKLTYVTCAEWQRRWQGKDLSSSIVARPTSSREHATLLKWFPGLR